MVTEYDTAAFDAAMEKNATLVVDFFADWCGPCRMLAPVMETLSEEFGDKARFVKINVDDNPAARREAEARIKQSAANGCDFCLIHHASAEQLVNKNKGIIDRLDDYTKMIRDAGLIPGLSAHMPEMITYTDQNGYDIETYIQIFNCVGFLMQVEIETVASIIQNAKKPVMNIKSMAAGRVTPYVGLTFNWNVLRPCDMVTVGAFSADEVHEDVEISLAALEHRFPNMEKRASPVMNQAAFG